MLTVKITTSDGGRWHQRHYFDASVGVPALVDFRVNDATCRAADYWFVIEDVPVADAECVVPRERTIFLTAESAWPVTYYMDSPKRLRFLSQFGAIYTCHFVDLAAAQTAIPFLPWLIDRNHKVPEAGGHIRDLAELMHARVPEKGAELSVICSTQNTTSGHRLRLDFVRALKRRLGARLHWFGNGIDPVPRKWDAISPFRYTLVLENNARFNVVTEKIYDAFLGFAFPIYWGAPNIHDYFPSQSLATIQIEDAQGAIRRVESLLEQDPYESVRDDVLSQRERVLREFNPFVRIQSLVLRDHQERGRLRSIPVKLTRLEPFHQARSTISSKARRHLSNALAPK